MILILRQESLYNVRTATNYGFANSERPYSGWEPLIPIFSHFAKNANSPTKHHHCDRENMLICTTSSITESLLNNYHIKLFPSTLTGIRCPCVNWIARGGVLPPLKWWPRTWTSCPICEKKSVATNQIIHPTEMETQIPLGWIQRRERRLASKIRRVFSYLQYQVKLASEAVPLKKEPVAAPLTKKPYPPPPIPWPG